MQSDQREFLNSLSERVLGAVFEVANTLGAGNRSLCLLVNFQKPTIDWKRIVYNFPD
jgi:hypothetical protein